MAVSGGFSPTSLGSPGTRGLERAAGWLERKAQGNLTGAPIGCGCVLDAQLNAVFLSERHLWWNIAAILQPVIQQVPAVIGRDFGRAVVQEVNPGVVMGQDLAVVRPAHGPGLVATSSALVSLCPADCSPLAHAPSMYCVINITTADWFFYSRQIWFL